MWKLFTSYSRASDDMTLGFKYKMIRRRVKTLRNISVWVFCRAATPNISISLGTHPILSSAVRSEYILFQITTHFLLSFAQLLVVAPVIISAVKPKRLQRQQRNFVFFWNWTHKIWSVCRRSISFTSTRREQKEKKKEIKKGRKISSNLRPRNQYNI